ncbi:hypothetical protein [Thermomonas sp.]|uniref:hypothetical protein n=1 Tax=Thermomonas sp. TaxID=1971895 RepID=UPI0024892E5C|nr:hypothetical protein [Thermomonas sp.]MDI1254038.1 hypothetical protein [Thermomonas sp.]
MNRSKLFGRITIVAALTGLIAAANAKEPTNLPRVVAVASNIGRDVICYGYQCADMLFQLMPPLFPLEVDYLPDVPSTVDHNQFCTNLYAQKPSVCSSNNIPSTPLSDPSWQPNGCGDGSLGSNAMNFIVSQGYPVTGGTGLDQPANGVNFQSACNTHDLCY